MKNWYSTIKSSHGYTTDAFISLQKLAHDFGEQNDGKKLLCNVIVDEMSIRRHAQYNSLTMKFDGFVSDDRKADAQNNLPLAKDALVFLVTGVETDFKIPVAYFLTNGLDGDERAAITGDIFTRLNEIGIDVFVQIFDGLSANIKSVKALGAEFNHSKGYSFLHPSQPNRRIYVFLDAAHMLKLIRNCVGSKDIVYEEGTIEWKYFVLLYEAQKDLPWNLGNKLTKTHMDWKQRKMCVRTAAQTISNSVADSMDF